MQFDLQHIEKLDKENLSKAINFLIENDFNALINLLYKIDVDEKQMKLHLQNNMESTAGDVIADLIIRRQQQKQNTRKQFNQQTNIPDEEKW